MSFVVAPMSVVGIPVVGSPDLFPVRRVYCVGRNYAAHAREMGFDPDREPPFFFSKPNDDASIVSVPAGTTGTLPYPPLTQNYHYEAELVVAIGKGGRDIAPGDAAAHVFGYAAGLDMTRRDLQIAAREKGRPWEVGKAFDFSAPVGPITPRADVPDVNRAGIRLEVDGAVRQQATVAHLIWSVDEVIANLSTLFALAPGDLVFTGTPEGVGAVVAGQALTVAVDGLVPLSVRIA
ncbi:fumarylacetoacetate hydrolase family protein [Xylophilus sp. Leaf220]|uniref:fumarylacetoacetate hydrolase family protein n=1 Tax=Xylophilus sp. Leaf220 TaxID=1735686 RepID=UPI0006FD7275|nr:fumarylacetoacetate hydrolase family protein [Xylophilus sp. Leaf220]KQM78731.1 fumarylacetoacetate hydrolase [Xylophilus sp. Leaf220]